MYGKFFKIFISIILYFWLKFKETYNESLLITNHPFGNSPTKKNSPLTNPNRLDVMATHTCLRNVRT